jgi:predicted amidohydrolase
MTRVACQQLSPVLGDLAGNAALARAAILQAVEAGADVVVLPELITSGYMFESPEEAAAAGIGRDHPILAEWAELARSHDVLIAGGFCELGEDGRVHNSAVVCAGTAEPAVYRKLHLWDREKLIFDPGTELPPILETRVGRVAAVVCYDLEFPELTRTLALAGVQLLMVPTNWPLVPCPDGEHPPEVVIAMAAARVNRMAVACADRCGVERGQAWTQGSAIIGVDGWVAAQTREAGLISAELDLDAARDKRLTEHADAFADRRPALYGAVSEVAEAPR